MTNETLEAAIGGGIVAFVGLFFLLFTAALVLTPIVVPLGFMVGIFSFEVTVVALLMWIIIVALI